MEVTSIIGAAVALSWLVIKSFKVTDRHARRLVVLGSAITLCIGAKITGAGFVDIAYSQLVFKALIVAGGANLSYKYAVHPAAAEVSKGAKTLLAKLKARKSDKIIK